MAIGFAGFYAQKKFAPKTDTIFFKNFTFGVIGMEGFFVFSHK